VAPSPTFASISVDAATLKKANIPPPLNSGNGSKSKNQKPITKAVFTSNYFLLINLAQKTSSIVKLLSDLKHILD